MPALQPEASTEALAEALSRLAAAPADTWAEDAQVPDAPPRRRRVISGPELNVVPLVDVLFLLMVFFVIGGVFGLSEGILSSTMTLGGRGGGVPLPISPIVVELTNSASRSCEFCVRLGRPRIVPTPADLARELQQVIVLPGFGPDTPVIIRSADDVLWDDVTAAWNAILLAGYHDVAFGRTAPAGSLTSS